MVEAANLWNRDDDWPSGSSTARGYGESFAKEKCGLAS
jgi:hypothetical protein